MPTKVTRKRAQVVDVIHEPGNATRYRVVAAKLEKGYWVASAPDFRGSMLVLERLFLHYDYVMEKMRLRSAVDASEIAKAIARAVPRVTAEGCTDEKGKKVRS